MNNIEFREYCLSLNWVTEDMPFDEDTVCLRVGGKIFAMYGLEHHPFRFNLKCHPELAIELREKYDNIIPGYHCNKKHWNTVIPDGQIPLNLIKEMIDISYNLVLNSLSKKERQKLTLETLPD